MARDTSDSGSSASSSQCESACHVILVLVLQCLVQLAPQRGSQGGRHSVADLPVPVVHVAAEAEVVGEALCVCMKGGGRERAAQ